MGERPSSWNRRDALGKESSRAGGSRPGVSAQDARGYLCVQPGKESGSLLGGGGDTTKRAGINRSIARNGPLADLVERGLGTCLSMLD